MGLHLCQGRVKAEKLRIPVDGWPSVLDSQLRTNLFFQYEATAVRTYIPVVIL